MQCRYKEERANAVIFRYGSYITDWASCLGLGISVKILNTKSYNCININTATPECVVSKLMQLQELSTANQKSSPVPVTIYRVQPPHSGTAVCTLYFVAS